MPIYLVRHTSTILPKTFCYGQLDVELQKPYFMQFETILQQLPKDINTLYSSPLSRCKKLADYIVEKNKIEKLYFDDRLKELNFGSWEGKEWDNISPPELNIWMENFVKISTPNGESFTDLYNRSIAFLESIKSTTNTVIITHAGVIRSMLCYVNKKPLANAFNFSCNFGEVIVI